MIRVPSHKRAILRTLISLGELRSAAEGKRRFRGFTSSFSNSGSRGDGWREGLHNVRADGSRPTLHKHDRTDLLIDQILHDDSERSPRRARSRLRWRKSPSKFLALFPLRFLFSIIGRLATKVQVGRDRHTKMSSKKSVVKRGERNGLRPISPVKSSSCR